MEQATHAVELRGRRASGWSRARRDLLADWRDWSYAEQLSAVTGGAALALLPVLAWIDVLIR